MERRFEEERNQNNPMEPENRGKHSNEVGDALKPKSDRISFKTFRSCGAIEYAGQSDLEMAMQWIQNTEKVFRITEVLDSDKVKYASAMLIERALVWWNATYESLDATTRNSLTWDEFQKKFFEQYCPVDLQRRLEKDLLDLKQGKMTILDYETEFNKKERFAQRFLSSEQDKIEHFIGGLRKEIRSFVVSRDGSSFSKIVEYARCCEYELSIPDKNEPMSKRPRTERMMSTPTQRFSRFSNQRRIQSQSTPRVSSQAFSLQSSTPRDCRRCGKTHKGRCDTDRSVIKCFCCGEAGHVRMNYPREILHAFPAEC
ncbi:uncharacterized protein LOC112504948 [Cynara cardunculus var. scolymus]|uniref:uncharacterized protein LOC112504948 n=1 Tax=Cynara cardunculus var. scolymus TaxID=59895 RepID=UPI000D625922|nr:uncharacterized protein LOC112504948 [Cynara cardunculus var. scolymus]